MKSPCKTPLDRKRNEQRKLIKQWATHGRVNVLKSFLQDVCSIIVFFFTLLPYPSIQLIPVAWENTRFDIAFSNLLVQPMLSFMLCDKCLSCSLDYYSVALS